MKSLWFISLLLLLLVGCVSIKPNDLTIISPDTAVEKGLAFDKKLMTWGTRYEMPLASRVTLYKATLDIKKHHLTGMLVVKSMDSMAGTGSTYSLSRKIYRIVFANEIGMTFFDLEIKPDSFRVISCFESLNKKALLKIFETDFRLLTRIDPVNIKNFYVQSGTNNLVTYGKADKIKIWQTYSPAGDTLSKMTGKSTIADPALISYLKYSGGFPTKITIENPFIGMKLSLRLLDRK